MAESTTIATLKHKRDEIARSIVAYEKRLSQARADLAYINAAITIFAASGERQVLPPYVDVHRLFARGEAMALCKAALASGPMNTRQLAIHVMKAKGLDAGDRVLAQGRRIPAHSCAAPASAAGPSGRDGTGAWREGVENS